MLAVIFLLCLDYNSYQSLFQSVSLFYRHSRYYKKSTTSVLQEIVLFSLSNIIWTVRVLNERVPGPVFCCCLRNHANR